jgi:hypothetical protein
MKKMAPLLVATALACAGCATQQRNDTASAAPAAASTAPAGNVKIAKSQDGSFEGEIVGTPARNSKFARLKIGMNMDETQTVLGRAPDRFHTYESGKRWIPFYFGNDARRMQVLYKGEGCLIFTGGNAWGGGGSDLIRIEHDAGGACYQP